MKIVVVGGGAAGFFAALAAKRANPQADVRILEKSAQLLSKVRISGGGRCNVTHACFEPRLLAQNYPRGHKELLGPFHRFQPRDTITWFKERGVPLKTEPDGRMFPTTDNSGTIINCLLQEARNLGIVIRTQAKLRAVRKCGESFELDLGDEPLLSADRVILATGSARPGWEIAKSLGHTIQEPVPSLFTFNIPKFSLVDLAGVSAPVTLRLEGTRLEQSGPLLITHWGFSGPAALKLSAWGARYLAEKNYEVSLRIDWLSDWNEEQILDNLRQHKRLGSVDLPLPKSLWKALCKRAGLEAGQSISTLGKAASARLSETLKRDSYSVHGKTTNKEEFVTCGGVSLSEVNFKSMESKQCAGLFFSGEVLDIDGVTGGFNFQNAWTTGWIAGLSQSC